MLQNTDELFYCNSIFIQFINGFRSVDDFFIKLVVFSYGFSSFFFGFFNIIFGSFGIYVGDIDFHPVIFIAIGFITTFFGGISFFAFVSFSGFFFAAVGFFAFAFATGFFELVTAGFFAFGFARFFGFFFAFGFTGFGTTFSSVPQTIFFTYSGLSIAEAIFLSCGVVSGFTNLTSFFTGISQTIFFGTSVGT
ncbi:hypothetical protein D9M71_482710 [compost metagenome]